MSSPRHTRRQRQPTPLLMQPPRSTTSPSQSADLICEAVKAAAEENDIPIGFFVRLLWQESRFRSEEVSSAGAQGIAQFMPQTAVEMGLRNPFDPLQAIPASAKFLRKLSQSVRKSRACGGRL